MKTLNFILILLVLSVPVWAETALQEHLRNTTAPVLVMNDNPTVPTTTVVTNNGLKSVKKALFYSAVLPGAGQYYNGSWKKAAGFLAVEAAGWAMFAVYQAEGNDIEDEFHLFADTHWSEDAYWDWIWTQQTDGISRDDLSALREWERSAFSHGLHVEKDQQYYEMIGKYYQFNWGWDDFRSNPAYNINLDVHEMTANKMISDNRYDYETKRNDSNEAFKKATTGTTIVIFNHILSAFEAAWSAKRQNARVQTSLRFEPRYYNNKQYTALTLRMNW